MAQQDYVNKARPKPKAKPGAKSKSSGASRSKQAPAKPKLPSFLIAFTLVISAGFAYFLWSIQGASDSAPKQETQAAETPQGGASSPEDANELEDDEYRFYSDLEKKKVHVDVKEMEKKGPWLMQCASFKSRSTAETLKAKMAFVGLDPEIRKTGSYFRVILGPYESKRKAERHRTRLRKENINNCEIWLWN